MKELGLVFVGLVAGAVVCNCLKPARPCPCPCPPPERPCEKCPCHRGSERKERPCKMVPFYDERY